jgi:hypothetical protein
MPPRSSSGGSSEPVLRIMVARMTATRRRRRIGLAGAPSPVSPRLVLGSNARRAADRCARAAGRGAPVDRETALAAAIGDRFGDRQARRVQAVHLTAAGVGADRDLIELGADLDGARRQTRRGDRPGARRTRGRAAAKPGKRQQAGEDRPAAGRSPGRWRPRFRGRGWPPASSRPPAGGTGADRSLRVRRIYHRSLDSGPRTAASSWFRDRTPPGGDAGGVGLKGKTPLGRYDCDRAGPAAMPRWPPMA